MTERLSSDDGGDAAGGFCAVILTIFSVLFIILTFPITIFFCIRIVQEYERAVIFRLGRLLSGGARGPGVFFVIPCVDIYEKVDLRTNTYEIPPQEVQITLPDSSKQLLS